MNMHAQIHLFDRELIHEHVSVLHGRAAGIDGVLVLAVYGEDPTSGRKLKFPVERFAIGDVDRIVETIMLYENREHANVYIGLNVMRRDLGAGKRGGTQDLVAVTGLVGDFDEGDGTGESRMPVRPSFVLETSPGNHQCFILFDNPMKPADAALLAKALQAATGADFGTGDVTHVWRLAGTANWPNAKKVLCGRSPTPYQVRVHREFTGKLYSAEELRTALAPWMNTAPGVSNSSANDDSAFPYELLLGADVMAAVKEWRAASVGDRSAIFFTAVRLLKAAGRSVDLIERFFAKYPNGVAGRYKKWRQTEGRNRARVQQARQGARQRAGKAHTGWITRSHRRRARAGVHQTPSGVALRGDVGEVAALRWTRWAFDETLHTFSYARIICREFAAAYPKGSAGKVIASGKTVAAVERLARADRLHAATTDQWDANLWLLNTPHGTIDLRTGKIRAHQREDYLTKSTAVGPSTADCPKWKAHLHRVLNADPELIAYLQRMLGYCLTGDTTEHALFFCYGTGANGKGVTINTVASILKDYGQTASVETFTASRNDRHLTELAVLRGARLVTVSETEEGRR